VSISNFTELKSSIADFLNRDDLTNVIPTFIRLAEAKMNRDIRHWRMETRKTALLDNQFTALPIDFLSPVRMTLNTAETKVLELAGTNEISKLIFCKLAALSIFLSLSGESFLFSSSKSALL